MKILYSTATLEEEMVHNYALAADALNRGTMVVFNAWGDQVFPATQFVVDPEKLDLGRKLTIMAYDTVWEKWFLYTKRAQEDLANKAILDHFADNDLREFHRR